MSMFFCHASLPEAATLCGAALAGAVRGVIAVGQPGVWPRHTNDALYCCRLLQRMVGRSLMSIGF